MNAQEIKREVSDAYSPDINMAWKRANALAEKYGVIAHNKQTINTYGWPDLVRMEKDILAKQDA